MTHSELVNEYIKLFKKAYEISEEHWNDKFFRPLENAIKNSTTKTLYYRLSSLKRWALKNNKIQATA